MKHLSNMIRYLCITLIIKFRRASTYIKWFRFCYWYISWFFIRTGTIKWLINFSEKNCSLFVCLLIVIVVAIVGVVGVRSSSFGCWWFTTWKISIWLIWTVCTFMIRRFIRIMKWTTTSIWIITVHCWQLSRILN